METYHYRSSLCLFEKKVHLDKYDLAVHLHWPGSNERLCLRGQFVSFDRLSCQLN